MNRHEGRNFRMKGEVLNSRYELDDLIGSGGMADVYRARDLMLGRTVAVKVLHQQYARDPVYVERLHQEARAAANLNQPNIVSVFDWGVEGDLHFIVMEYVEGFNLKEMILQGGVLMPERAVEIAVAICQGLEAAHSHGIIHRDIKPQNVIVTRTNQVKVMDFGIARAAGGSAMTQTGTIMGTAQYISPEQAQGRSADPRSDLYSLGVLIYEMLTGKVPFDGETPVAIAYMHVREDPLPPSVLNPDISPELVSVVMKALAKNPENRYQNAREMQADLERCLEGAPVHATPVLPADDLKGATRAYSSISSSPPRRRSLAWVWIIVGLLVLGGAGAGIWALISATAGIHVPKIIDKTQAEAERLITEAELSVGNVASDFSPDVEEGKVISQNPKGGTSAERGMRVDFVVSKGAAEVLVPDCRGRTAAEAEDIIKGAGLKVGSVTEEYNKDIEKGKVASQDPAPGAQVAGASEVNLAVSKGPEMATVPNVVGLSSQQAQSQLSGAGFVANVETVKTGEHADGMVFQQNPAAGQQAAKGTSVAISVASSPQHKRVPDVTGMQRGAAESALNAEGFTVRVVEQMTDPSNIGLVIRQSPAGGSTAGEGEQVTIYVGVSS